MRIAIAAFSLALCAGSASAQTTTTPATPSEKTPAAEHSTGRTQLPEDIKGQEQPQGPTGPEEMKSGGAPAESPQGQTPPGMIAAPEGSSETIVGPKVTPK